MIRVLIADDHAIVRRGLKQIVGTTADIFVAGEAAQGNEVLDGLRAESVDLIRRIRAERPTLPVLVLTMHNEAQIVSRALRVGASGYVTKDSDPEVLLAAIRKLASGGKFIDPGLVDAMVFETNANDAPPHEILSDREFHVLQMLAAGKSITKIAETLVLSAKTISTHKMRLMQKLGLATNAELIRYAIRHGLASE